MKAVRLTLAHSSETIHPMHRFVAECDEIGRYRMVSQNHRPDEVVMLFHVEGDRETYEAAIRARADDVVSVSITDGAGDAFFVTVRSTGTEVGDRLIDAFTTRSLVTVPPVEYRSDWTIRFGAIGEPDDLRAAIDAVPDGIDVRIDRIGEYDAGGPGPALTARQREVLRVAREHGYFEVPRETDVETVAEAVGCAPGTAAEHLRKAERAVIEALDLG